jgi:4-cresol dehydrogenase (hydroxylating)
MAAPHIPVPPGVSEADFADAVRQWKDIVGEPWVFTDEESVALYRDGYSPFWDEAEERVASAAIAPDATEQVQAIMRIAHEKRIPIYPISTGRNLGYGGSAPVLSGSVVLDLKRMNRVLEVSERNAYALVEPGVSYFDLYNTIEERGLKVWIDPPDPGWGSVVGNALDGGGGWTAYPFRDHFGAHCGMEVVLANGDLVRTGMGAISNSKTWQQNRWGYGPWVDGLFRQSNMGVVTKMGFHLMPRPDAYISGTATVQNEQDIVPLLDTLNLLENQHVVNGSTSIGAGGGPGGGAGGPRWTCTVPIYGPASVIRAQLDYAKAKFAQIPGSGWSETPLMTIPLTSEQMASVRQVSFAKPNLSTFSIGARSAFNPNPTSGHIWFSPIVPRTGEAMIEFYRFYQESLAEVTGGENLNFLGPIGLTNWERSLILMIMFPVTRDKAMNAKNVAAFRRWVELAGQRGWGEYRTAPAFMDDVAGTYDFNNHALRRLHETIKDGVDPNGIISAGRYGIWPKHIREA